MATSSNTALESGIIRTVHDRSNQFAQINRALLQNSALSWEARGVLAYLLSKPEDWEVRFTDLVKQGPGAEDRMRRICKELERAGHLVRKCQHGADGRWRWVTVVFENPADVAFSPYADFPHTVKPDPVKPDTENRHIKKEQKRTNTESTNKEDSESAPRPVDIPTVAVDAEAPRDMPSIGRKLTPGVNAPKPTPGTPLPRDWVFNADLRAWAMGRGLTPDQADDEHDQFCAHYWSMAHDKHRGWRADWLAAEHGWFLKRDQFTPPQKGTHRDNIIPPDKLTAKLQGIAGRIATLNGADGTADDDVPRLRAYPIAR